MHIIRNQYKTNSNGRFHFVVREPHQQTRNETIDECIVSSLQFRRLSFHLILCLFKMNHKHLQKLLKSKPKVWKNIAQTQITAVASVPSDQFYSQTKEMSCCNDAIIQRGAKASMVGVLDQRQSCSRSLARREKIWHEGAHRWSQITRKLASPAKS